MKLKTLGLAALAAMALTAVGASTASATTVEVEGKVQSSYTEIESSLSSGTSTIIKSTGGLFANTCTQASFNLLTTIPWTGTTVSGLVLFPKFSSCSEEPVTIDSGGYISVERIGTTTNGTLRSEGATWTVPSPFGKLTCSTGAGTDIGTLTGSKSFPATMDIKGVINCGIISSAVWEGTLSVTRPWGLGVVS